MDTPRAIPESHPLHRLFRGLTEYAFMNELGIGDPPLVGYVAELLASFVPEPGDLATARHARSPADASYGDDRRSRTPAMTPPGDENAIAMSVTSRSSGPASIPRPWPNCRGRARPMRS